MEEINNFEELKDKLKGLKNEKIIFEIFDSIRKTDKEKNLNLENAIINCINKCKSPLKQNIRINNKEVNLTKFKTIFNAFNLFPLNKTRILIIGQDPYPDSNKAEGLAFSVNENYKTIDASLLNIYKAAKVNISKKSLISWAKENMVLLLNTALTHEHKKKVKEHKDAWEPFINEVIKKLISSENRNKLVVFLWGKHAQCTFFNAIREMGKFESDKCYLMRKMILMTSHPSNTGGAVNQGFSNDAPIHFKACDDFLGKIKNKYTWKDLDKWLN